MIKTSVLLFSFFISTLTAWASLAALEVVEPAALCDRFEKKSDEAKCLKFVNEKKPDTYVSSTCQSIDDNNLFMQCLDFATKAEIDPRELETCAVEDLSDQERWACLKKTAKNSGTQFQRLPAEYRPQKKSSGKKR